TSSTPITASDFTASRRELRERPSRSPSSFSGGRRWPGPSSPETIISLIVVIATSVTATLSSYLRPCRWEHGHHRPHRCLGPARRDCCRLKLLRATVRTTYIRCLAVCKEAV